MTRPALPVDECLLAPAQVARRLRVSEGRARELMTTAPELRAGLRYTSARKYGVTRSSLVRFIHYGLGCEPTAPVRHVRGAAS